VKHDGCSQSGAEGKGESGDWEVPSLDERLDGGARLSSGDKESSGGTAVDDFISKSSESQSKLDEYGDKSTEEKDDEKRGPSSSNIGNYNEEDFDFEPFYDEELPPLVSLKDLLNPPRSKRSSKETIAPQKSLPSDFQTDVVSHVFPYYQRALGGV